MAHFRDLETMRTMSSAENGSAVAQIGAAALTQTRERRWGQDAHKEQESAWSSLYVLRRTPLLYMTLMCVGFAIGLSRCESRLAALQSTAVFLSRRRCSYPDDAWWVVGVVRGLWLSAAVVLTAVALVVWRWATALAKQGVVKREAPSSDVGVRYLRNGDSTGSDTVAEAQEQQDEPRDARERVLLRGIVLLRCAACLYFASAVCTLLGLGLMTYFDRWGHRMHIGLAAGQNTCAIAAGVFAQIASIGCFGELKWRRAFFIVVWEGAIAILWFCVSAVTTGIVVTNCVVFTGFLQVDLLETSWPTNMFPPRLGTGRPEHSRRPELTVALVVATTALASAVLLALYLDSVSVSLLHKWRDM